MAIQRMNKVLIVVEDLEAAKAFFTELGMELEGESTLAGRWVDRVVGLDGVRADIATMRTPDGHGRVELSKFDTPSAVRAEPESAPANTLELRRTMFAVDDGGARRRDRAVRGHLSALLPAWPRGDHHRTGRAAQLSTRSLRAPNQNVRECETGEPWQAPPFC